MPEGHFAPLGSTAAFETLAADLVTRTFRSVDFVSGVSGWEVDSVGNAQFADVVSLGNVTLTGSGVIRTATSGNRIELGVTPDDNADPHLEFYSGDALENAAGFVRMYVDNDGALGFGQTGAYAAMRTPELDFGSSVPFVFTELQLWSEQDAGAGTVNAKAVLFASTDLATGNLLFTFDRPAAGSAAGWQIGANAGTAAAPAYSFADGSAGVSDLNTGIYWASADLLGLSLGGTGRFLASTAYFYGAATYGGALRYAAGAEATPALTFTGTTDSGFWRRFATTEGIGVSVDGAMVASFKKGGTQNITAITQDARFLIGGSTSMNNIGMSRNSTGAQNQIVFENPNNIVGSIVTNGSATAFNTSSDERRKRKMRAVPDVVPRMKSLNAVRHTWKEDPDGPEVESITAQSILEEMPWAVSYEIEDDPSSPMLVDYSRLVPLLVATIQDQEERLAILEAA